MKNIKNINIHTNFGWTIKMFNKNSFIKRINNYANDEFLLNKINALLNQLNEVTKINNNVLFTKNQSGQILQKNEVDKKKFIKFNTEDDDYVFNYRINLNENYSINKFIEYIDLMIYFDKDNYLVCGGCNWHFSNSWKSDEKIKPLIEHLDGEFLNISSLYLNNLIKNFFSELLVNLSFMDLIKLIKQEKLLNLHNVHIYANEVYKIADLYEKWNKYMYEMFFYQFYTSQTDFYEFGTKMFDFFLLIFINYFAIADELKKSFYKNETTKLTTLSQNHENVHVVIRNLAKLFLASKKQQSAKKEYISTISNLHKDNLFLSSGNVLYDISIEGDDELFNKNFFSKKKDIYLYCILILYPEFFGINEDSQIVKNYTNFLDSLQDFYDSNFILSDQYTRKINKNLIYDNYNYSSFVRGNNFMIFHHEELSQFEIDLILANNFLINCIVLCKALNFRILNNQWHLGIEAVSVKNKFLYKQIKQEVEDISRSTEIEDKNSNLKTAIKDYSNKVYLKQNIDFLKEEVNLKDEFDKRQRFIEIIIIGFIVASLISLIDFMNMVWTDINCSYEGANALIPRPFSDFSIIFSSVIIFINTFIFLGSLIYLIYAKKKNSDIANRKEVKL